jgi:alpha-galactosidase
MIAPFDNFLDWLASVRRSAEQPTESAAAPGASPNVPFSFQYGESRFDQLMSRCHISIQNQQAGIGCEQTGFDYRDPETGLRVGCSVRVFLNYPAIDFVLNLTNDGLTDSLPVSAIRPLDVNFPAGSGDAVTLHALRGGVCSEEAYSPNRWRVEAGECVVLGGSGGRSSGAWMPWFTLADERGGMLAAIGWSGQWQANITRDDSVRVQAGLADACTVLHPGETIRTPRIILVFWEGANVLRGFNLGRRLLLEHYVPRAEGKVIFPPVSKLTPYDELDVKKWQSHHGEANQLEAIEHAAPLGIEAYWLDAYWFEGYYPRGLGNWQFPVERTVRDSFPRGLRPLADAAHSAGLKFVLWFGPEVFSPGTYIDREKPHWTLRLPTAEGGIFNLAIPEAREWMTSYVVESLREFDVDVCRMDLTREPLDFWKGADEPNRTGMTEIGYITGLYRMWDEIRAGKSGVWIDNCASGGQRIDIELCSRSLPLWRSDFNDSPTRQKDEIGAISDQAMTMGLSLCVPLHGGPVWRPQPYYWRSSMAAGMNLYWDLRPEKTTGQYTYDRELTRKAIEECKSLRPFYLGDFYPLTEINTDPGAWAAYEYIRPEYGDGFAVFFRRPYASSDTLRAVLEDIEEHACYEVSWHWTYDLGKKEILKGEDLRRFAAHIPEQPGSLLVRFGRVQTAH